MCLSLFVWLASLLYICSSICAMLKELAFVCIICLLSLLRCNNYVFVVVYTHTLILVSQEVHSCRSILKISTKLSNNYNNNYNYLDNKTKQTPSMSLLRKVCSANSQITDFRYKFKQYVKNQKTITTDRTVIHLYGRSSDRDLVCFFLVQLT